MSTVKILSRKEVKELLKMKEVIEVVQEVYKMKSQSRTDVWPTVFYDFVKGKADMDIKSGYLKSKKCFGHKTVTWFSENEKIGIETLNGIITVFDSETGIPIGITDSAYITGIRTGASGALGAKYLARENSEKLLVVGAGNQAFFQIGAILTLIPTIKSVKISSLDKSKTMQFIEESKVSLKKDFDIEIENIQFEAVEDLENEVKQSDIIITVTPSRNPIIKAEWVSKGTHISCIGSDMEGKQEIDSSIFKNATVFVDDINQAINVGEIEIPIKEGILNGKDIDGEIGDLILSGIKGRKAEDQITIFDATGMALLDIAVAKKVLEKANELNVGISVEI